MRHLEGGCQDGRLRVALDREITRLFGALPDQPHAHPPWPRRAAPTGSLDRVLDLVAAWPRQVSLSIHVHADGRSVCEVGHCMNDAFVVLTSEHESVDPAPRALLQLLRELR